MTFDFKLPDIGEGISEAIIVEWLVGIGDAVEEGTDVAVVSTDKADVELASPRRGTVSELLWKPGQLVKVGQDIMRLNVDGSADASLEATDTAEEPTAAPKAAAAPAPAAGPAVIAAPATRKLAAEMGIDLATITGSGPNDEIRAGDLTPPDPAKAPAVGQGTTVMPLSNVYQAMATRMRASICTHAHATLDFRIDATALLQAQKQIAAGSDGVKVSMTAVLAKCTAAALKSAPRLNATLGSDGTSVVLHDAVNLGVALASEKGLFVPVVRDVAGRSGMAIATDLQNITERGRVGNLSPDMLKGGTFTLSNTGSLEQGHLTGTTPIINTPQVAILWVSRIRDDIWVDDGQAVVRPTLRATLAIDHACADGADAMAFINAFTRFAAYPEAAIFS